MLSHTFVVPRGTIPKSISRPSLKQFYLKWEKVVAREASMWRAARKPQEVTAGILFGKKRAALEDAKLEQ